MRSTAVQLLIDDISFLELERLFVVGFRERSGFEADAGAGKLVLLRFRGRGVAEAARKVKVCFFIETLIFFQQSFDDVELKMISEQA